MAGAVVLAGLQACAVSPEKTAPLEPASTVQAEAADAGSAAPDEKQSGARGDERMAGNLDPPTVNEKVAVISSTPTPTPTPTAPYRIAPYDELDISVYDLPDLSKVQSVRPDGEVSFPLVGEIHAAGLTPEELRMQIVGKLSPFLDSPEVTVIVSSFKNRKVSILGEVNKPGVYDLEFSAKLLDLLALAEGVLPTADLRFSTVLRDGKPLPVNLEKLLRQSDFSQNISLQPNDTVLVSDSRTRRVLVMGEVANPTVIPLTHDITVLESIALANGLKRGAQKHSVAVIRGGFAQPNVLSVDVDAIMTNTKPQDNLVLEAGDIVYVSRTAWAQFADFLRDIGLGVVTNFIVTQPGNDVPNPVLNQ